MLLCAWLLWKPCLIRGVVLLDDSNLVYQRPHNRSIRGMDELGAVLVAEGRIIASGRNAMNQGAPGGASIIECKGAAIIPGLVDTRVFIGEPGYEYRETIASAGKAAAAGGVTTMVMMPDTDPVIDDVALVEFVGRTAREASPVNVLPAAAVTKGLHGSDLTEIGLLQAAGAVAFTEGRKTIANGQVLRRAMTYARDFGALITCETNDPYLGANGVMNEGLVASWLGLSAYRAKLKLYRWTGTFASHP